MNKSGGFCGEIEKDAVSVRSLMRNSSDLHVKYARAGGVRVCVLTCDGQTDQTQLAELIYRPLSALEGKSLTSAQLCGLIGGGLLMAADEKAVSSPDEAAAAAMCGFCVILVDGARIAYAVGVQGFKTRSVDEPRSHQNIRGSREGFVEALHVNISLVRRRIRSKDLVFREMTCGSLSNTEVSLVYIEKRADKKLVSEVAERLGRLPLSLILESGYIQPFLEDGDLMFSQAGVTERPDVFCAKLYEGKVGVLVDGSPFALVVPQFFTENFIMLDDYLEKPVFTGFIRLMRYFAFLLGVLLPGFYVALADYHPELIPGSLLVNLSAAISATPYSLIVECVLLDIFYEIMREAGLRLPSSVGHAVSIVGGIVIGDIVVSTGLVAAPTLVITAIASISSYIVPDLYAPSAVMRILFIIAGGAMGLFGISALVMIFMIKLCSVNAYGMSYTSPLSPFSPKAMRDTFIRMDWRYLSRTDHRISDDTERPL